MGINSAEEIINLDKDALKFMKKNTQEDSVNQEVNYRDLPKSGLIMLAALDSVALVVTCLYNRGMDLKMKLLNIINFIDAIKNWIAVYRHISGTKTRSS